MVVVAVEHQHLVVALEEAEEAQSQEALAAVAAAHHCVALAGEEELFCLALEVEVVPHWLWGVVVAEPVLNL